MRRSDLDANLREALELHETLDMFVDGGALGVLKTYLKLHKGKVGAHWLWSAIERITVGESEQAVLADYGYVRENK